MRIAGPILFVLAASGGGILAWQTAGSSDGPKRSPDKAQSQVHANAATNSDGAHASTAPSTHPSPKADASSAAMGAAEPAADVSDTGAADAAADSDNAASRVDVPSDAANRDGEGAAATEARPAPSDGRVPVTPIRFAPAEGASSTTEQVAALLTDTPALQAYYAGGGQLRFVTDDGPALTPAGRVAQRWLHEARFHHLVPVSKAYAMELEAKLPLPPAAIEAQLAKQLAMMAANLPPKPRTIPVVEDRKTGAYLSPDVLWQGKAPAAVTEPLVRALMAAATDGPSVDRFMRSREPSAPQYRRLVEASQRYEADICSKGEWEPVFVPKNSVGKGWERADEVKKIQRRLAREGLFTGPIDGIYGDALEESLTAFQERTNLKPVGRFNRPTAKNLNIPCNRRVRVLALNANRWRYSSLTPETKTYVHVNLPGFHLRYFRDGKFRADRRVIVGKGHSWYSPAKKRRIYRNATPILSDVIHSIIFNPTWTLPTRVILNEVGPKIEKDPDWLKKNGYIRRKRGDGRDAIIQLPSKNNALGDVKFYFPNSESIYLHDTNRRGLFMRSRRDFSHGCIRVHKAVDFATEVIKDDLAAKGEEYKGGLKTLAAKNNTVRFPLHSPVAVFLEYYTATVNDEGTILFHPDIYDYDYAALIKPIGKMLPVWPKGR